VVRCLLGLSLLPAHDIVGSLQDIRITIATDGSHSRHLQQLVAYVKHQWLDRRSVGPNRLCVRDNRARTNNILELRPHDVDIQPMVTRATKSLSTNFGLYMTLHFVS